MAGETNGVKPQADKCCRGPGYASPLEAYLHGAEEKLVYLPCIIPDQNSKPDYLVTVDVDPDSSTYSQVIHRLEVPHVGDELHHSGWNACSSCHLDSSKTRKYLILPGMRSGRVYAVDVHTDSRKPRIHKVVEPEEVASVTGTGWPHTTHCLASGDLMISMMGTDTGKGQGNFILIGEDFKVKSKWTEEDTAYGYDFWYQPRLNVMVSTELGVPNIFYQGFDPSAVASSYGRHMHVWNWKERTLRETIDLGEEGLIPLEVRFAHDPDKNYGFVGCALSSNIILFQVDPHTGKVSHKVVIKQPWAEVEGWALPSLPPLVTDILISLDDRFLYFSNWLRGDLCQYDISNPEAPRLVGRVWLGGSIAKGGPVKVAPGHLPDGLEEAPDVPTVKGVKIRGGPQMIQLSLDGRRLYVTNSLLSPWDQQFYPEMFNKGSHLLQIDVDTDKGGLSINENFLVDFGAEPGGPVLAHEVRYPGGDCSSDIWV